MEKYRTAVSQATDRLAGSSIINSKTATCAIHTGHSQREHPDTGYPVIPPISLSTTFSQNAPSVVLMYGYTRSGNYKRDVLEAMIAAMEDAKYCVSFSSGLATLSSITQMLSVGDHVTSKLNIVREPVDIQDEALFKNALQPNTKLIWLETPSNPLMRIVDIKKIVELSKQHNPKMIFVVGNTFLTPVFQLPPNLGADIVMHSLTKDMNGHSNVLMGAAATYDRSIFDSLRCQQQMVDAVPSPFDCYMALRGLHTLTVRMAQHQLAGLAVALYLNEYPKIEKALHPEYWSMYAPRSPSNGGFGTMLEQAHLWNKVLTVTISKDMAETKLEFPVLLTAVYLIFEFDTFSAITSGSDNVKCPRRHGATIQGNVITTMVVNVKEHGQPNDSLKRLLLINRCYTKDESMIFRDFLNISLWDFLTLEANIDEYRGYEIVDKYQQCLSKRAITSTTISLPILTWRFTDDRSL